MSRPNQKRLSMYLPKDVHDDIKYISTMYKTSITKMVLRLIKKRIEAYKEIEREK